jgi:hypothetical protein
MADAALVELGRREVERIGLARGSEIRHGMVVRVPKAYPVYDADYRESIAVVRGFLAGLENIQTVGRNGLHRYDNQDHAMLTGILAARNLALGARHDLWRVNTDPEYHEELRGMTPEVEATLDGVLVRVFRKVDRLALGLATGTVAGAGLALATLALALRGGHGPGPDLGLLGQYFPGYEVTALGSVLALGYGFAAGFVAGWAGALVRNAILLLSLATVHRRAELSALRRLLEHL